jgi:hypothetical protein
VTIHGFQHTQFIDQDATSGWQKLGSIKNKIGGKNWLKIFRFVKIGRTKKATSEEVAV